MIFANEVLGRLMFNRPMNLPTPEMLHTIVLRTKQAVNKSVFKRAMSELYNQQQEVYVSILQMNAFYS